MKAMRTVKAIFILFFIIGTMNSFSQKQEKSFYGHYEATIDNNERISLDLIFSGVQIIGYYNNFNYGETISIELEGDLTDDKLIKLYTANDFITVLTGTLTSNGNIEGIWSSLDESKSFETKFYEVYQEGSLKLSNDNIIEARKLMNTKGSPIATFQCNILNPLEKRDATDTIRTIMLNTFLDTDIQKYEPEAIIDNIKANFFKIYSSLNKDNYTKEKYTAYNWMKQKSMSIRYNEDYIISVNLRDYAYTGGSFGTGITNYLVFDSKDGKLIKLNSIFNDDYSFRLNQLINIKIREKYKIPAADLLSSHGFFVPEITIHDNFFIDKLGIGFHFNKYEIAAADKGEIEIFIPFKELLNIIAVDSPINWLDKN